tara:strand:- start:18 stop:272 length:255 start_codon:yes stop_codon:yes gene_type:complete
LDPLDPLTEIIKSGQAFSLFIFIERLLWVIIGIFFFAAFFKGVFSEKVFKNSFMSKLFLLKVTKKDEKKENSLENKTNEQISKN